MNDVDYTKPHKMKCGHTWRPNKLPCGYVVNTKKVGNRITRVRCMKPAVWYDPSENMNHNRRCAMHLP